MSVSRLVLIVVSRMNGELDDFWERNARPWTEEDEARWRQQQQQVPFYARIFAQIKAQLLDLYWDFLHAWHVIAHATGLRRFMTLYKLKLGAAGLG